MQPGAFETLTEALERHRSSSPTTKIHYYPPQPQQHSRSPSPTAVDTNSKSADIYDYFVSRSPGSGYSTPPFDSPLIREAPGNFIDPNESAGLPGNENSEAHARHEASKLVQAHTRKKGFKTGFRWKEVKSKKLKTKANRTSPPNSNERSHFKALNSMTPDIEQDAESISRQWPTSGGVLSTLLTLYNQETGASTPALSQSSYDGHSESEHRGQASAEGMLRRSGSFIKRMHTRGDSQSSLLGMGVRTPNTRNAGGVFGPLIASTGNLSGVAAPAPSRLQPNIKRPGYHLSRCVLLSPSM